MTDSSNKYDALARRLLRAELAARGARDLDVAEYYVARMVRLDPETGEHVGTVDHNGKALISMAREGCPAMNLDEVLAETMKIKPELFGGASVAPGRVGQPPTVNPFKAGKDFNASEIMLMYQRDPELAERLAAEANFWKINPK